MVALPVYLGAILITGYGANTMMNCPVTDNVYRHPLHCPSALKMMLTGKANPSKFKF